MRSAELVSRGGTRRKGANRGLPPRADNLPQLTRDAPQAFAYRRALVKRRLHVAYRFKTASMETCCTLTVSGAAGFIANPTRRSLASLAESMAVRLPL